MRWTEHVAQKGKMRDVYKILVGSLEGRYHSDGLGINGRITLK
jgi:hypothetical protein